MFVLGVHFNDKSYTVLKKLPLALSVTDMVL